MSRWPQVVGELETLRLVAAGKSIARYGDGELKMCEGSGIKSQDASPTLAKRLREILKRSGDCLVGIPNLHSDTKPNWQKFHEYARLLHDRQYVSAFITRPDSAPWINVPEYWELLASLWRGRDVTLVRGSSKSFTADDLIMAGAGAVTEIVAERQHAWKDYESLLGRVGTPSRALLCLGPTATVMAVDLCARGVHAIDLGHAGMFWRKHLRGDPMWVTDGDKKS